MAQESKLKESEVDKLDRIKQQLIQEKEAEIEKVKREGEESLKVAMKDLEDTKSQFKQTEIRIVQERQKH
jgi:hypothetical protein